jgi:heterodisulfide reductase subunit A-like polyferredoxin
MADKSSKSYQRKRSRQVSQNELQEIDQVDGMVDVWSYVVIGGGIAGISCSQELSASTNDSILLISSSSILKEVSLSLPVPLLACNLILSTCL